MSDPATIIGLFVFGIFPALVGLLIVGITRLVARRLPSSLVVEYLPPRQASLIGHGLAMRADHLVLAAAIVNLAVSGRVRMLTRRSGGKPIAFQVLDRAGLSSEEHALMNALQPRDLTGRKARRYLRALNSVGVSVGPTDPTPRVIFLRGRGAFKWHRSRELPKFFTESRQRLADAGLARPRPVGVHLVLLSLLFLCTVVLGLILILGAVIDGEPLGAIAVLMAIAVMFGVLLLAPPPVLRFTRPGVELRRHLAGLRDYIGLTDQHRLQMLQSPAGALRTPAGGLTPGGIALGLTPQPTAGDPVAQSALDQYVLTERLLPYAILFRQEKKWATEFERLGGAADLAPNLRSLATTLEVVITIIDALSTIGQILRAGGLVASLFTRH